MIFATLLLFYIIIGLYVAYKTFKRKFPVWKNEKFLWRQIRRAIWFLLPGKVGTRSRRTWTHKCVRREAKEARKQDVRGDTFMRDLRNQYFEDREENSWTEVLDKGNYLDYEKGFCRDHRETVYDALWEGILWLPLLVLRTLFFALRCVMARS